MDAKLAELRRLFATLDGQTDETTLNVIIVEFEGSDADYGAEERRIAICNKFRSNPAVCKVKPGGHFNYRLIIEHSPAFATAFEQLLEYIRDLKPTYLQAWAYDDNDGNGLLAE